MKRKNEVAPKQDSRKLAPKGTVRGLTEGDLTHVLGGDAFVGGQYDTTPPH